MIKGIHGLFYSSQPDELRAFLRDKLQLPWTDVGGGWPIYDLAEGDLGVHPTEHGGESGQHGISFFTDDVATTVAELKGRGVEFDDEVADHGYGLVTHFTMPGGVKVQLYQPKYQKQRAVVATVVDAAKRARARVVKVARAARARVMAATPRAKAKSAKAKAKAKGKAIKKKATKLARTVATARPTKKRAGRARKGRGNG
jgi:hypothetical protein